MLAFNSIKYYSVLRKQLERLEEYITFVESNNPVNEKQKILKKFLKCELGTGSSASFSYIIKRETNGGAEVLIKSYMDKFKIFKSEFDFMGFYGLIREIEVTYTATCNDYLYNDECYKNLLEHLNSLAKLYQNVFQSDDKDDIILFFDEAEKVCYDYFSVKNGLLSFVKSLENNSDKLDYDLNKVLELQLLDIDFGVGEFGNTLALIEDSYNSIKMLIKSSSIENLKIIKVESGSLLTMLLGDKNIIDLLTTIIRTIATEMYQKFTVNGKLEKQKNIMEIISSSADVIEKLDRMGINTGKSKSDLKDSLNIITNNIYKIISKSGKIKLNDEILSVGENQKLLDYKTLYLSNSFEEEKEKSTNE